MNRRICSAELAAREADIAALREELDETNKGVVALYAELDDKAEQLRDANDLKSRFLSYMSHEFRTPLTSMTSITGILLSRLDGPLTTEQQKQVEFIRGSARELTEMVNDLLDLAKVEAGRITISPEWFEMVDLFAALRGMFKPIAATTSVSLVFDEPEGEIKLYTDDKKIVADPAQFHLQRAQVHARRRGARLGTRARRRTWSSSRCPIPASASRPSTFPTCSRISCSSTCGCRGACAAPASGCRWRASSPSCWVARVSVESELGKGSRFSVVMPMRFRGEAAGAVTS